MIFFSNEKVKVIFKRSVLLVIFIAIIGLLLVCLPHILPEISSCFNLILNLIVAFAIDQNTRWMLYAYIGVHFFILLLARTDNYFLLPTGCKFVSSSAYLLVCLLLWSGIHNNSTIYPLILVLGLLFQKNTHFILDYLAKKDESFLCGLLKIIIWVYCVIFAISIFSYNVKSSEFLYHGMGRDIGFTSNPNSYGLLVGSSIILLVGSGRAHNSSKRNGGTLIWFGILLAIAVLVKKLLNTYSRGAWLGTALGLIYWCNENYTFVDLSNFFKTRVKFMALIKSKTIFALLILAGIFAQNQIYSKRLASLLNPLDFSWKNRSEAWIGGSQILADNWIWGAGWNKPLYLYEYFYMAPNLVSSGAFSMNDYLFIGCSIGLLGLLLFLTLLIAPFITPRKPYTSNAVNSLSILLICRSASLVFIVGFLFDGGIFKIQTAVIFWILFSIGTFDRSKYHWS